MARKEIKITIQAEGDDRGKVFVLTRMSAVRAEKWATRVFLALARSGFDIPPEVVSRGMAGVAAIGIRALSGLQFAEAEPLLDEMMACVQIVPDPARAAFTRATIEDDFEEVSTLITLRRELLNLHLGFFPPAVRSIFQQAQTTGDTPNTSMSP